MTPKITEFPQDKAAPGVGSGALLGLSAWKRRVMERTDVCYELGRASERTSKMPASKCESLLRMREAPNSSSGDAHDLGIGSECSGRESLGGRSMPSYAVFALFASIR